MRVVRVYITDAEEVEGGYILKQVDTPIEGFVNKETFNRFYSELDVKNLRSLQLVTETEVER